MNAYPKLVEDDLNRLHRRSDNTSSLQFLSCTGSTIEDVLSGTAQSQIDALNTTSEIDFALLSIGGNDLGFFEIMNSCIFRFYSFYSGTCADALSRSAEALASPKFEHRLRLAIMEILDIVQWEKRPWFTVFITGYARFFNDDTHDCDERSFGVWWRGPKLKRGLRRRMNQMVVAVNEKIKDSIETINADFSNPRVMFVDYDAAFEGHRFCEPNVTEPDYDRNETWFFLVGNNDNSVSNNTPAELWNPERLPVGSPLVDPKTCLLPAEQSGDWGMLALCLMAKQAEENPALRTNRHNLSARNDMWYVPTYYGKTFHPVSKCPQAKQICSERRLMIL